MEAGWGDCRGLRVAILGPTGAATGTVAGKAERRVGLQIGVRIPVSASPRLQVVIEADSLPIADSVFDRVLLLHAPDKEADGAAVLREVWRMTAPEGRILLVVPNVFGVWAWCGCHPFRQGRPVTATGLRRRLAAAAFEPQKVWGALRAPPLPAALYLRVAAVWERVPFPFPGVLLAEGLKRMHVPTAIPGERRARRLRPFVTAR